MAFLRKQRTLPNLTLCENPLPWVDKIKHLGNMVSNVIDGGQLDMKVKNARYIEKNNSLCQELHFAHPQAKVKVNNIYNSHFTGSQLWKFGSRGMEKLEATYNRSIKVMFNLPWATHRYMMEPLTGLPHIRRILVRRYLSFIRKIQSSEKVALRKLLDVAKNDVRTTTGTNLRTIMLYSNKNSIDEVLDDNIDIEYHTIPEEEAWRPTLAKEIIDIFYEEFTVSKLGKSELEVILEFLCTD